MLPRGWAALVGVAVSATSARAQVVSDGLGIERFRVAVDRAGLLDVEWADTPAHRSWDAGILVGFAHDPLVLYDRDMNKVDALVEQRLTTTLVGSLGLWDRFELGGSVDVVGYQTGDDGSTSPTMKSLPAGGLGDLRLLGKAKLAGDARYQIAFVATLTAPGGGARGFLREAGVTFAPAVALSATRGPLRGAVNAGYLLRKGVDTAGVASDDEGFVRAGAAYGVGATEAVASASFAAPLSNVERNQIAIELLAGVTQRLSPTVGVFVAAGAGLDNGFGTPDWRALAGVRLGSAPVVIAPPPIHVEQPPVVPIVNEVKAPPPPGRVSGLVVDATGRPIAGASITTAAGTHTSDEDGRFTLEAEAGHLHIDASAAEYQDAGVDTDVPSGGTASATITLVRKIRQGQLRGQVLSFDGKPLPATITITGTTTSTATADADGNFNVELPEGSFQVEIAADGYRTQKRTITVKLDGVTVLNVDLRGAK